MECLPSQVETSSRPRKRRFPEAVLLDRIKKYEDALQSYGADIESIRAGLHARKTKSYESTQSPAASLKAAPRASEEASLVNDSLWVDPNDEFEETQRLINPDLDKDERQRPSILSHFDRIYEDDGAAYFFGHINETLMDSLEHPGILDILKFWQAYIDNVHPIFKGLHAPTIQRLILQHGATVNTAPASDQALLAAMYLAATTSLSEADCLDAFNLSKHELCGRFQNLTQRCLRRAGLWRTSDLAVLQAFVLYLVSLQNVVDPRSLVSFTAMADRIARRLRLHHPGRRITDNDSSKDAHLQIEMGKRIWWELCLLEIRSVQKAGMGTSDIHHRLFSVLPFPVSDMDLVSFRDDPRNRQHTDVTPSSEMIFFLIRCEMVRFLGEIREQQGDQAGWTEFSTTSMTLEEKLLLIRNFEQHISRRYLSLCNDAVAHHRFTRLFTEGILSRLRLPSYVSEETRLDHTAGRGVQDVTNQKKAVQRSLLQICTDTLAKHTQLLTDPSFTNFNWFLFQNMPFIAMIHALRLLRKFSDGHLVDEAWKAVESNASIFSFQGSSTLASAYRKDSKTALASFLVDSMMIHAWQYRRAALKMEHSAPDPSFIIDARDRHCGSKISNHRSQNSTDNSTTQQAGSDQMLQLRPQNQLPDVTISDQTDNFSDQMGTFSDLLGMADRDFNWDRWLNDSLIFPSERSESELDIAMLANQPLPC